MDNLYVMTYFRIKTSKVYYKNVSHYHKLLHEGFQIVKRYFLSRTWQ